MTVDARGAPRCSRPTGRRARSGRRDPPAGARATRSSGSGRGRGAVLHRRHRRRDRRVGRRPRRDAHGRGPRGLRGRSTASRSASATAGREVLTNPPPSAGGILIAHALALLDARAGTARRRADRRGDGAHAGRAHAGVPRRARRARSSSSGSCARRRTARLDDPHRGDRPRRAGRARSRARTARARA